MKKILILIMATILLFTACDTKPLIEKPVEKDIFVYEKSKSEYANNFTVDKDNKIYQLESLIVDEKPTSTLTTYDVSGEKKTYEVQCEGDLLSVSSMCVANNCIYYISSITDLDNISKNTLCKIDLSEETKKVTALQELNEYTNFMKMEYFNDKIYILSQKPAFLDKSYSSTSGGNQYAEFMYYGEALTAYDIKKNTVEDLPIELPITFSVTQNDSLMVYSHDGTDGFYFVEYKDGTFREKTYNSHMINLRDFTICNEKNDFVMMNNNYDLAVSKMGSNEVMAEIMEDVNAQKTQFKNGYLFYYNCSVPESCSIERVKLDTVLKDKPTIKLIIAEGAGEAPFSCGFNMSREVLAENGFDLNIMSQATDFDICLVNSEQPFANTMKTKGVFEPLQNIPAVANYLDKCIPSVKEAATNAKGDIWMLPLILDVPVICYNKANCEKEGFNLTNKISIDEFIHILNVLKTRPKLSKYYNANAIRTLQSTVMQYPANESSFHAFRRIAMLFKENMYEKSVFTENVDLSESIIAHYRAELTSDASSPFAIDKDLAADLYNNFLFDLFYTKDSQLGNIITDDTLSALPFPRAFPDCKNNALCTYICINPYSENKDTAIQYVSELATHLLTQKDSYMLSDPEMYTKTSYVTDLLEIYSNAKVNFSLPNSILYDCFDQYVDGRMNLNEFIAEADRKWEAYRNE